MARPRDWERAQRDSRRARGWREQRDGLAYAPGEKGCQPATPAQAEYIGRLCALLGRTPPPTLNRRAASSLIAQLKQNVATTRPEK